jgi:hypothetical protein
MATISGFTGHFDDAGHMDDQPVVIVAGYIGTDELWSILKREWIEVMGTGPDGKP